MIVINHRKSSDVVLLRIDASQLDGQDLTGAYLLGAGMAGLRARGVVMREANLRNADLRAIDLTGADLRGAVLRGADLRGADLTEVLLIGADLRAVDLRGADLRGADLSRAMLFEADLTGVRCDFRTRWPAGDNWGVVAQPLAQADTLLERAGLQAHYTNAQRLPLRWRAAYQPLSRRLPSLQTSTGVIGRLAGVAMAVALVIAASSNLEVSTGTRARPGAPVAPSLAARAPISSPEARTVPAEVIQAPKRRSVSLPPSHRLIARKPVVARHVPRRMAALRVVRRRAESPRIARSDFHRSVRTVSLVSGSRTSVGPRNRSGGESGNRTGRVLLTASFTSQRPKPRPAREVVAVAPSPALDSQPSVIRVAAVPVHSRPRPRKVQEAWGNPDFHYGSGYDIYTMHLGRRQD